MSPPETHAVQARYARRDNGADAQRYSLYANAAAMQAQCWQGCVTESSAERDPNRTPAAELPARGRPRHLG